MNNLYKLYKQGFSFVFFSAVFLSLSICSSLQAAEVVQIEPGKIRLMVPPGNAQSGIINIYNNAEEPKNVRVYLEDWAYLPVCDGTKDFKPSGTTSLSAARWISFVPSEFTIPAFGKKTVNYTVRVPPDAKGGHYAVLFFENYLGERQAAAEGVTVNLAVRVASLFYVEPKGTIERQAKISNLKFFKKEGKFYLTANLSNTGNVDITAKATFFIIDQKGIAYARGEFNEVYTFPGDTAVLTSYWKEQIPRGKYDLILTTDIGKALKEAGQEEAPAMTQEAQIQVGEDGEVVGAGELK